MLKKLRVKKINAASHGVVNVSERPPWVEPSRFLARWTLQPKVLEKLYTFEEHQQRNVLTIQNAIPPIGKDILVSERNLIVSHRDCRPHPDSYPVTKHSFLFSKSCVELPAGMRPENKRLFQLPMRLVAATLQVQHPVNPLLSPDNPKTPLASHIRKNRRRPPGRNKEDPRKLNSVLDLSPGSPESPLRQGTSPPGTSTLQVAPLQVSKKQKTNP